MSLGLGSGARTAARVPMTGVRWFSMPCRTDPSARDWSARGFPHATLARWGGQAHRLFVIASSAGGGPALAMPAWASVTGGAVDPLPDEVGVAVVPRVLLDHVQVDPA